VEGSSIDGCLNGGELRQGLCEDDWRRRVAELEEALEEATVRLEQQSKELTNAQDRCKFLGEQLKDAEAIEEIQSHRQQGLLNRIRRSEEQLKDARRARDDAVQMRDITAESEATRHIGLLQRISELEQRNCELEFRLAAVPSAASCSSALFAGSGRVRDEARSRGWDLLSGCGSRGANPVLSRGRSETADTVDSFFNKLDGFEDQLADALCDTPLGSLSGGPLVALETIDASPASASQVADQCSPERIRRLSQWAHRHALVAADNAFQGHCRELLRACLAMWRYDDLPCSRAFAMQCRGSPRVWRRVLAFRVLLSWQQTVRATAKARHQRQHIVRRFLTRSESRLAQMCADHLTLLRAALNAWRTEVGRRDRERELEEMMERDCLQESVIMFAAWIHHYDTTLLTAVTAAWREIVILCRREDSLYNHCSDADVHAPNSEYADMLLALSYSEDVSLLLVLNYSLHIALVLWRQAVVGGRLCRRLKLMIMNAMWSSQMAQQSLLAAQMESMLTFLRAWIQVTAASCRQKRLHRLQGCSVADMERLQDLACRGDDDMLLFILFSAWCLAHKVEVADIHVSEWMIKAKAAFSQASHVFYFTSLRILAFRIFVVWRAATASGARGISGGNMRSDVATMHGRRRGQMCTHFLAWKAAVHMQALRYEVWTWARQSQRRMDLVDLVSGCFTSRLSLQEALASWKIACWMAHADIGGRRQMRDAFAAWKAALSHYHRSAKDGARLCQVGAVFVVYKSTLTMSMAFASWKERIRDARKELRPEAPLLPSSGRCPRSAPAQYYLQQVDAAFEARSRGLVLASSLSCWKEATLETYLTNQGKLWMGIADERLEQADRLLRSGDRRATLLLSWAAWQEARAACAHPPPSLEPSPAKAGSLESAGSTEPVASPSSPSCSTEPAASPSTKPVLSPPSRTQNPMQTPIRPGRFRWLAGVEARGRTVPKETPPPPLGLPGALGRLPRASSVPSLGAWANVRDPCRALGLTPSAEFDKAGHAWSDLHCKHRALQHARAELTHFGHAVAGLEAQLRC